MSRSRQFVGAGPRAAGRRDHPAQQDWEPCAPGFGAVREGAGPGSTASNGGRTGNVGPVARLDVVVETMAPEGAQNHVLLDGQQTARVMLHEMPSRQQIPDAMGHREPAGPPQRCGWGLLNQRGLVQRGNKVAGLGLRSRKPKYSPYRWPNGNRHMGRAPRDACMIKSPLLLYRSRQGIAAGTQWGLATIC